MKRNLIFYRFYLNNYTEFFVLSKIPVVVPGYQIEGTVVYKYDL